LRCRIVMKVVVVVLLAAVLFASVVRAEEMEIESEEEVQTSIWDGSNKKGIGLANPYNDLQVNSLKVGWYYTWGNTVRAAKSTAAFVPMVWGKGGVSTALSVASDYVLGFNEPDFDQQSNIPVADAIKFWPQIVAKAKYAGAPAVAGNPTTGPWLPVFMAGINQATVSFVTMHWYKSCNPDTLITDINNLYNAYKKPVWITEYACQTIADATAKPTRFTDQQVMDFMAKTSAFMKSSPMVARYAWHDSTVIGSSSCLFKDSTSTAGLSVTGAFYAAL